MHIAAQIYEVFLLGLSQANTQAACVLNQDSDMSLSSAGCRLRPPSENIFNQDSDQNFENRLKRKMVWRKKTAFLNIWDLSFTLPKL